MVEEFAWTTDTGDRLSWERVDSQISSDDNWKVSLVEDGTPGAKNSVSDIAPPNPVTLLSPTDNQNLTDLENIELLWENPNIQDVTFELIVSPNADLTDPIIDEPNLTATNYLIEELALGAYYWQVITTNGVDDAASPIFSFTLVEPTYSDAILINELLPDPSGDETQNEWIELFNPSAEAVNLKGWILEDIKGSIHQYKFAEDFIIAPGGYAAISRQDSGITLNNDQDGARLYWPNGKLLFETSVFSDGQEDWTWARKSNGAWAWTTKPTRAKINIFAAPPPEEEEAVGGNDEEPIIVNTVPIAIPAGDFKQYEHKLVKVTGTVVETSGNTFYLDDGSGKAKIYIQDKTGIDKPEMRRGDIFEVIGIVNLYRTTWRILPRQQADIKLIQAIKSATNTSTAKTASTAKKTTTTAKKAASSSSSAASARSPTSAISEVETTGDKNVLGAANFKLPTPFWVQLMEFFTGLAAVFLILLVVKVMRILRPKVIGGNFGNDYT